MQTDEITETQLRKVGQFLLGQLDRQKKRPCMSANGAYLDGWYAPDKAIPPYVTESEFNAIKEQNL